jgi:acyl-CoA dehydrogenase
VHRVSVARQVLAGYRAPEGPWPREHVPERREAARHKFAALLEAATTDA